MLIKVSYRCESCGNRMSYIREVNNNELYDKLSTLKYKCIMCGKTISPEVAKFTMPYFTVLEDKVLFLDNTIMQHDDDNIIIDLTALVNLGYSGAVTLITQEGNKKVLINSAFSKIDRLNVANEMKSGLAGLLDEAIQAEARNQEREAELLTEVQHITGPVRLRRRPLRPTVRV